MAKQEELKLVFEGSSSDADLVSNILEDAGIQNLVKNKNMGTLFPHYATHGGIKPVKIFVRISELENAKNTINAYFNSEQ